jgi:hypothetical protein
VVGFVGCPRGKGAPAQVCKSIGALSLIGRHFSNMHWESKSLRNLYSFQTTPCLVPPRRSPFW